MGHKIFVSYKYSDDNVEKLNGISHTTVRDYVTEFENQLDHTDHIYKGEHDDEDLSQLSDDTIWSQLRDRIYDSTLTIIFISPNMKTNNKLENKQWIPWEVSYSLKETSRKDSNGNSVTSKTNAMIAVVLPDNSGLYSYFMETKDCCNMSCILHHTDVLFRIISQNKFNRVNGSKWNCENGRVVWTGSCSYIEAVKWSDFKSNITSYIERAYERQDHIGSYDIKKNL